MVSSQCLNVCLGHPILTSDCRSTTRASAPATHCQPGAKGRSFRCCCCPAPSRCSGTRGLAPSAMTPSAGHVHIRGQSNPLYKLLKYPLLLVSKYTPFTILVSLFLNTSFYINNWTINNSIVNRPKLHRWTVANEKIMQIWTLEGPVNFSMCQSNNELCVPYAKGRWTRVSASCGSCNPRRSSPPNQPPGCPPTPPPHKSPLANAAARPGRKTHPRVLMCHLCLSLCSTQGSDASSSDGASGLEDSDDSAPTTATPGPFGAMLAQQYADRSLGL